MEFTNLNFKQEVEESSGIVLVDFFAPWCGPCKMMGPIIEELISVNKDKNNIKIGKVNVDENQEVAEKYGIMSIPSLILFKNGVKINEMSGLQSKSVLQELLDKA